MDRYKIVTIGVYGCTEEQFFGALQDAGVDLFCDIRNRRGLRGTKYAFANSQRLQARLKELGIGYTHLKELSPPPEMRAIQKQHDQQKEIAKRKRAQLSPEFVQSYRRGILEPFDFEQFFSSLPPGTKTIAFFCVERQPEACHRSILAGEIQEQFNFNVEDITPCTS